MATRKKIITVSFKDEEYEKVERWCEDNHIPIATFMRMTVLKATKKEVKE
jgi:putative IMPACT (imprinted ancient) family translation regulator